MAAIPQSIIVEVAPQDHMLALRRAQREEHIYQVIVIRGLLSNLDVHGCNINIT
jgi:hypothetical protein